jgi:hypothetical protein
MDDRRAPLRGRDQGSQQGRQHNQRGTPPRPAAEGTGAQGRDTAVPDRPPFQPLPHGSGEVAGWRHGKFAAHRTQLGLNRVLPPGPVSHW